MIFWKLQFVDGSTGWQVMDDGLNVVGLTHDDGRKVKGSCEYSFVTDAERPTWAPAEPEKPQESEFLF